MSSDPTFVKTFKDFMKSWGKEDISQMEGEFFGPNARAVCILQSMWVEGLLEDALKTMLRADLSSTLSKKIFGDSPAGTLSAKIDLAYAFPLFGRKTYHDLGLIRLLRNEFAHSRKPAKFADPPLATICKHLQLPDDPIKKDPPHFWRSGSPEDVAEAKAGETPKLRYLTACYTIAFFLGHYRDDKKRGQPHPSVQLP